MVPWRLADRYRPVEIWWHTRRNQISSYRTKRKSPFKSAGGRQFSRLLAAEVCASAVVMLDTTCSEVVWRVLTTHSIRQFPLHFLSCASPCAITFHLESNNSLNLFINSNFRISLTIWREDKRLSINLVTTRKHTRRHVPIIRYANENPKSHSPISPCFETRVLLIWHGQ